MDALFVRGRLRAESFRNDKVLNAFFVFVRIAAMRENHFVARLEFDNVWHLLQIPQRLMTPFA
jgi:hypothetical protein